MDFYDLKETGTRQLIIGRDDGLVQVYEIPAEDDDADDDVNVPPILIFSQVL